MFSSEKMTDMCLSLNVCHPSFCILICHAGIRTLQTYLPLTWSPNQILLTGSARWRQICSFLFASCFRNGPSPMQQPWGPAPTFFRNFQNQPHCSLHQRSGETSGSAPSSEPCFPAAWDPHPNTEVMITSISLCSPAQGVVTAPYLLSVRSPFSLHFYTSCDSFCSGLSLQRGLHNKQLWELQILSPFGAQDRLSDQDNRDNGSLWDKVCAGVMG